MALLDRNIHKPNSTVLHLMKMVFAILEVPTDLFIAGTREVNSVLFLKLIKVIVPQLLAIKVF